MRDSLSNDEPDKWFISYKILIAQVFPVAAASENKNIPTTLAWRSVKIC